MATISASPVFVLITCWFCEAALSGIPEVVVGDDAIAVVVASAVVVDTTLVVATVVTTKTSKQPIRVLVFLSVGYSQLFDFLSLRSCIKFALQTLKDARF